MESSVLRLVLSDPPRERIFCPAGLAKFLQPALFHALIEARLL